MRVAIFSDVHANVDALKAVLDDIGRHRVDARLCLGDSVGYGAEPRACLDLLFASCTSLLAGNHDLAASGLLDGSRFSTTARDAVDFARRAITPSQRKLLARLPDEDSFLDLLLVHASPTNPREFPYVRDAAAALQQFDARRFCVAFYGHTHLPLVFRDDGERVTTTMSPFVELDRADRYLCNVGSVGQPRDQDPRACYAIYDSEAQSISFRRVDYDVEAALARIQAAGLPEQLGTRLLVGV
jgi:diadenosine tetraphosphatase ApaH/serine/threonine PP2A family protein phosphatase